ncbi:MAG: NADH-quinone oxidoreductase subunit N [Rickettsiales bacterium]
MYVEHLNLQLYLILPEILLALSGMGMALHSAFHKAPEGVANVRGVWMASLFPVLALLLHVVLPSEDVVIFSGMLSLDRAAFFMKAVILTSAFFALLLAGAYYKRNPSEYSPEFSSLVLLATAGMTTMVMARHFLSLYVALELQSLALYVLAAIHRKDGLSSEAGMKYFALGSLSSCIFLFGASLIYGATGSLYYDKIAQAHATPMLAAGVVMALVAFFFKISAAPFHMWTPDVYQGAPKTSLAFFAGAGKAASLGALINIAAVILYRFDGAHWREVFIFVSLASALIGALGGIAQKDLRRLVAFSSVGHMGYALFALIPGTQEGLQSAFSYIAVYAAMTVGFVACLIAQTKKGALGDTLDGLKGMAKERPGLALATATLAFSMAGVPPFAGFFAKLLVFKSLVASGYYVTAGLGIACSVIASFYYLRIVKFIYFDEAEAERPYARSCVMATSVLTLSALFNVFFVFGMDVVMAYAKRAAFSLL